MIECLTYRMSVHTTADDPRKYRTEDEEQQWMEKDPLDRFQKYLENSNLLSKEEIGSLEEEVESEIKGLIRSWEKQQENAGDPIDMFDHVFETLPAYLEEQKENFRKGL